MSVWIAKLLGPIVLLLAISMVWRPAALLSLSRQFINDKPLILISGVLAVLAPQWLSPPEKERSRG